jgi:hypothetical protein
MACSFSVLTLTEPGPDWPEHPLAARPIPTAATNSQARRFITTSQFRQYQEENTWQALNISCYSYDF